MWRGGGGGVIGSVDGGSIGIVLTLEEYIGRCRRVAERVRCCPGNHSDPRRRKAWRSIEGSEL